MPGINFSSAVGLSSSDVVMALRAFFMLGVVLPVMALVVGLLIVPRLIGLFRHFVLRDRSVFGDAYFDASGRPMLLLQGEDAFVDMYGGPSLVSMDEVVRELPDDRNNPDWVSMPGDLPGLTMEYEKRTGYGFSWSPSTAAEIAALDPGLPEIYRGHDPGEFDGIQEDDYEAFRARCDELDREQAAD